jgi:hypothetical protein
MSSISGVAASCPEACSQKIVIPDDVLGCIFDQIKEEKTFLQMRRVCKWWDLVINKKYYIPNLTDVKSQFDDSLKKYIDITQRRQRVEAQEAENRATDEECAGLFFSAVAMSTFPLMKAGIEWLGLPPISLRFIPTPTGGYYEYIYL